MRWAAVVLVAGLLTSGAVNAERVADRGLGLTIHIPSDWIELPTTEVNKHIGSLGNDNPELADAVRKHGFIPIHLFGRVPKPGSPFSATVDLARQPAPPLDGESVQQALLTFLAKEQLPNAKRVAGPEIVRLAGKSVGHMTAIFRLNAGGDSIPLVAEAWVIPRGAYYLVLGTTYHADTNTGDRAEVMQIVNSLKLTDSPAPTDN